VNNQLLVIEIKPKIRRKKSDKMLHRQDCHTFHKTAVYKYGAMTNIEEMQ